MICYCLICFDVFADKDRELNEAQAEIKALKLSERLREKAVEEVIIFIKFEFKCLLASVLCFNLYIYLTYIANGS